MRLIDADELKKVIDKYCEDYQGFDGVIDIIDNASTAITDSLYEAYCKMNDEEFEHTESFTVKTPKGKIVKFVKERPQGEWKCDTTYCFKCNQTNCGADMRGDEK